MNSNEQVPGVRPTARGVAGWWLTMSAIGALAWTLILGVALLASGCNDATGPSEDAAAYVPQFQKTAQDGLSGGGGGGSRTDPCSRPSASLECALKAGALAIGGGAIAACSSVGVCLPLVPAWGLGAHDYINTPDCRSCGYENSGTGTGRSIGPTDDRNLRPGSPPDTGGY